MVPPGPSVAAVHGPGGPSMVAALGPGGPILGGTIDSVIDHTLYIEQEVWWVKTLQRYILYFNFVKEQKLQLKPPMDPRLLTTYTY